MMKLSISQAWDECRAILARDGKLIVPVALALFVLPGIVLGMLTQLAQAGQVPRTAVAMVMGLAFVISLVGQLSVITLALISQTTVGDAIAHGARRVLAYVGAMLIWSMPILVPASILYQMADSTHASPSVAAALGLLALTAVFVFVAVRMVLLSAVASAEGGGPLILLRRSWDITRGNWWRLFGFLLIFGIGALILVWATGSAVGVVARLTLGELKPLSIGALLVAIVAQLTSAALSVVLFVMVARLYAQRAGSAPAQASVPSSGI